MFSCYTHLPMKHKNTEYMNAIHEKFIRIVNLYEKLEKTPRPYGTDELLTGAEIHLIESIGDSRETSSVTDLANLLGITKGAVSQHLKKLEKKGLTIKDEDPENNSRLIVRLTSKGKAAYYAHRYWHETMDGGYKKYFANIEQEKMLFLLEFMTKVEDFLNRIVTDKK